RRTSLARTGLLAGLAIACLLAVPAAQAHANLVSSDPPSGYRYLDGPPNKVTLVFSEAVDAGGSTVKVLDLDGNQVDAHDVAVQPATATTGPTMTVGLQPLLPGGYTV